MDIAEIRKKAKSGNVGGKKPADGKTTVSSPDAVPVAVEIQGTQPLAPGQNAVAVSTIPAVVPGEIAAGSTSRDVSALDRLFAGSAGDQFASEEVYQTALVSHGTVEESEESQFLAFQLGNEEYALDINRISEIIKPREYTDIPRVPGFILGLISLRGVVVPIFDLKQRFQMGKVEPGSGVRIIVCRDGEITVGLLVDRINQVVKISADRIEPPPAVIAGIDRSMITGIGRCQGRMIIMLNLASVLEIVNA